MGFQLSKLPFRTCPAETNLCTIAASNLSHRNQSSAQDTSDWFARTPLPGSASGRVSKSVITRSCGHPPVPAVYLNLLTYTRGARWVAGADHREYTRWGGGSGTTKRCTGSAVNRSAPHVLQLTRWTFSPHPGQQHLDPPSMAPVTHRMRF